MKQLKTMLPALIMVVATMTGLISCKGEKNKSAMLKLNLEKGKTYEYDMTMNMDLNIGGQIENMTMKMGYSMHVADVKDSDQVVEVNYHRITMDAPTSPGMPRTQFDSDKPDTSSDIGKIFKALADARFTVVMTPDGKVKEVKGIREMYESMLSRSGVAKESAASAQMDQIFSEENVKQQLEQGFNYLPNKEVKVGDSWQKEQFLPTGQMPTKLTSTYTVKEIKDKSVILDVNSIMSLHGSDTNPQMQGSEVKGGMSGPMEVDRESGFPLSSDMKMDMVFNQGANSMKMTGNMKLEGKVK